jgi:hypothetical protein
MWNQHRRLEPILRTAARNLGPGIEKNMICCHIFWLRD